LAVLVPYDAAEGSGRVLEVADTRARLNGAETLPTAYDVSQISLGVLELPFQLFRLPFQFFGLPALLQVR